MTDNDKKRILALLRGEPVGEVCPNLGTSGHNVPSYVCLLCHGTGRINTEPVGEVERYAAQMYEEDRRHRHEKRELGKALEAERAASEEWRQKCVNERVRYDNEKEAHEETKRQLAESQDRHEIRDWSDCDVERQYIENVERLCGERDTALREKAEALRQLNIADCAHAVTVRDWEQRATEAEAARDAAQLAYQGVAEAKSLTQKALLQHMAHIDTLREALLSILAEPYGCPKCDSGKLRPSIQESDHWPDCPYRAAREALATTPTSGLMPCPDCHGSYSHKPNCPTCKSTGKVGTSGLMEKVRGLAGAVEELLAKWDLDPVVEIGLGEALTALYAEAPWLK